jgi:hypothetical protein
MATAERKQKRLLLFELESGKEQREVIKPEYEQFSLSLSLSLCLSNSLFFFGAFLFNVCAEQSSEENKSNGI